MRRGLILDLDNTVYNWVDAFLPSFRAMVHKLSGELGLEEAEIVDDFREVYKRRGTVEYPRVVEELMLWERHRVDLELKQKLSKLVNKVFSITYRQNLKPFPNVKEVLEWMRDEQVVVVGLSDALERWVCYRLRALGIERFFFGLFTWHREEWFDDRPPVRSSIRKRVRLSSYDLKPNYKVVEAILDEFSLNRENTFMVGDSISKDIAVAQEAGVRDVWARYGTRPLEKNLNTLREITPWTETEKAAERRVSSRIFPSVAIDDFVELKRLLGTERPRLFD